MRDRAPRASSFAPIVRAASSLRFLTLEHGYVARLLHHIPEIGEILKCGRGFAPYPILYGGAESGAITATTPPPHPSAGVRVRGGGHFARAHAGNETAHARAPPARSPPHVHYTGVGMRSAPRSRFRVAGHAADGTQTSNVYTHFSKEFMLQEGRKVIYNL